MYAPSDSGHHQAALAIERAIGELDPGCEVLTLDSLRYTSPVLEQVVIKAYMGMIKTTPELWDFLYDNPKIVKMSEGIRELIHRFNLAKLKTLLEGFQPHVVACTQAYPCGILADYKKIHKSNTPLVGVLTDYAPHLYWVYDAVDQYVVPSELARARLMEGGVEGGKITLLGIPIDPKFRNKGDRSRSIKSLGLDPSILTILVMGGGQGMGPIRKVVHKLDRVDLSFQILVVAGKNRSLKDYLKHHKPKFNKRVKVLGYAENVDELMELSSLIVTKPGGLTTAEALAKGLPMIIINPIPGQETKNTQFLLKIGVARKADNESHVARLAEELLRDPSKLGQMRGKARESGRPDSAILTAKFLLGL